LEILRDADANGGQSSFRAIFAKSWLFSIVSSGIAGNLREKLIK
jgi:hypothetical protein